MEEVVILGIDYSNEYTQISFFEENMERPRSVSTINGEPRYVIPTVLCKKNGTSEWCIGEEALHRSLVHEGFMVRDFWGRGIGDRSFLVDGQEMTGSQLFAEFVKALISLTERQLNGKRIAELVYTMDFADKESIDDIIGITANLGFGHNQVSVIRHGESFVYYMLNQPKSLWTNDVALFEFNANYFKYYRMKAQKNRPPYYVTVEEEEIHDFPEADLLGCEEEMKEADTKFLGIIQERFKQGIISCVYLLGTGFAKQWYEQSIRKLCDKRRVFQGQNLFSMGACYCLGERFLQPDGYGTLLLCEGRTLVDITILANVRGKTRQLLLSKAGTNWYHAGAKIECILDDVRTVQLTIFWPITKTSRNILLELEGFPYRPNKTTRIELSIVYLNSRQFAAIVRDKGFGDLFKASGKTVKQVIDIERTL